MLTKAFKGYLALIGGKVVQKENNSYKIVSKTIVIQDGIIERFFGPEYTRENLEGLYPGIKCIELNGNHVVYPGFIDLHTHYDYNMFPLWNSPREPRPWDNRHEWRKCDEYDRQIKEMYSYILRNWGKKVNGSAKLGDIFQYYSELQAIAGGTTVMQEPFEVSDDLYTEGYEAYLESTPIKHMLLRSTGVSSDLGLPEDGKVYSVIDFMKPSEEHRNVFPPIDTSNWNTSCTKEFGDFLTDLMNQKFKATNGYLVHLAEGRSGNPVPGYSGQKVADSYSRNEFITFMAIVNKFKKSSDDLRKMKISLIHGCGINLNDEEELTFIRDGNIGIIWSPVSNLLLYKDTPDFYNKLQNKNMLALGSDWSPSGSKHVWDEFKFAYEYLETYASENKPIQDYILDMITVNPAKMLSAEKLGTIKEQAFADLVIINCNSAETLHPSRILQKSEDSNIDIVLIGGNPVYFDETYRQQLKDRDIVVIENYQMIPDSDAPIFKKWCLCPKELGIVLERDIPEIDRLFNEMKQTRSKIYSSQDKDYRERMNKLRTDFLIY